MGLIILEEPGHALCLGVTLVFARAGKPKTHGTMRWHRLHEPANTRPSMNC